MSVVRKILIVSILTSPFLFVYQKLLNYRPEAPTIEETWWTDENPEAEDKNIYPFRINISQEILDDLKYRLDHTRPFLKPLQNDQVYGFNGDLAEEFRQYWATKYDWRKREALMNNFPHYKTSIQGLKIHFIHLKPQNVPENLKIIPMLLSHGWPSSFLEFLNVISILTKPQKDRDFVFEVVVPSLPGYAFSEAPQKPGCGATEIGVIYKNLMNRLGFERFYVHGGDLGALVLKTMATSFEDSILGFHSNMCFSLHPFSWFKYLMGSLYPSWIDRDSHREVLYPVSRLISHILMESGYLHIQSTKPDTYGVAVDDSPMGMAVQYLEKYSTATNIHYRKIQTAGLKAHFNYDDLLDNVMIYWVTKSGTSSFRFYSETFHGSKFVAMASLPVAVPSACIWGTNDIVFPAGILGEVFPNLVHSAHYDVGHFFGTEKPELLANDLFEAIGKMEKIRASNQERELKV